MRICWPGDFFLNTSIPVILPTLAVASKNYEHMLAESEEDSYELTKVVNATKRHVQVLNSLAHYLYNVLLQSHVGHLGIQYGGHHSDI